MTGDYKKSIDRAGESIGLQKSIKAYYRRGMAYAAIKDYWKAVADLTDAIAMDPRDPNNFQSELNKFEAAARAKDKASDKKLKGFLLQSREM